MAGSLRSEIERAVAADRLFVSDHARRRLRDRRIMLWQITGGLSEGKLLAERSDARPHPAIEVEQLLADGTPVKVVWSYDTGEAEARMVTVHFFDR
jgi:hypothetical protein